MLRSAIHPLENYLRELREIRSSGEAVDETSYYPALSSLLNDIGKTLKPKVRCILTIKNRGAGIPDGGVFTTDQFQKTSAAEPLPGQMPSRGVLEVKGTGDDAWVIADGVQVSKYWNKYRQVLVTNYRDFVLIGQDAEGNPAKVETYRLADNEAQFWSAATHSKGTTAQHGERFVEFLRRALLHGAPLADPKDVAWFLASYARDANAAIQTAEEASLANTRTTLEDALGLKFEGPKGEHFFRSSLVQTLFYGVFSAWVLWSKHHAPPSRERFRWREAAWTLRVPMIRVLFEQLAIPTRLSPIGLDAILDRAEAALSRVDRGTFFSRFEQEHAVQYFYEPFLEAFDPELRKELGVWYTPIEIVQYMVERVDQVLRHELHISDGLADPRVYVLDPCCGTGAYLVEVLKRIAKTLAEKGGDALTNFDLKQSAMERVFGFEILPAPFVVSHLQLGLLLSSLGVPLSEHANERVGVYLTNALTGWEPPKGPKQRLIPEMEEERAAADRVKRDKPILVVLGNPPYNGFASVAMAEERTLSNAYRTTEHAPAPQGQGLNDLYVRFFRVGERRIVEAAPHEGIVCFISNYSWLDGRSHTGMRERYLEAFDKIWIDSLNGDKYKTGKVAPDGSPDPSVFSTELNPEGIQVGTSIALLMRKKSHQQSRTIAFRQFWGRTKRADLLKSLKDGSTGPYTELNIEARVGYPFVPSTVLSNYLEWPLLPDLFPASFPGVKTSRDYFLIDIDRSQLESRIGTYFDAEVSNAEIRAAFPNLMENNSRYSAEAIRNSLTQRGVSQEHFVRYAYRPFDVRWLYWEPETKLLDEKRTEYMAHVKPGNVWLTSGQRNRMSDFYQPQVTSVLADHHIVESNVALFPLYTYPEGGSPLLESSGASTGARANISEAAASYLEKVGANVSDLFYHSLAIMHSPRFRSENGGALRQDWPRIPLPASATVLLASAELGRQLGSALNSEEPLIAKNANLVSLLTDVAVISSAVGASLDPSTGVLGLTAGWGHAGKGGVTMPAKGKTAQRDLTLEESKTLQRFADELGIDDGCTAATLGDSTVDVYLNETAYWKNVPVNVWQYTIGGYQVLKKWLSYRELGLLKRPLKIEEVREFTSIARRIAIIRGLEALLDTNYEMVKAGSISLSHTELK